MGRVHQNKPRLPFVFIAHPVAGEVASNLASAERWVRWAITEMQVGPIAPYLYLCRALDDGDQHERDLGIQVGIDQLAICDALWLCGETVSRGMKIEVAFAEGVGIPVHDLTGPAPPYGRAEKLRSQLNLS